MKTLIRTAPSTDPCGTLLVTDLQPNFGPLLAILGLNHSASHWNHDGMQPRVLMELADVTAMLLLSSQHQLT